MTRKDIRIGADLKFCACPNLPVQFIPTSAAESVIMTTLQPGGYTAILNHLGNTESVGIAEVFEME